MTPPLTRPFRSIRARLILAMGVILLVALVNVANSYRASRQRAAAVDQLSLAIRRQSLLTEDPSGVEAAAALAAAAPVADSLLRVQLPAAMDRERRHVAEAVTGIRRTEEMLSAVAWSLLLLSGAIGGLVVYLLLRTLPGTVRALEQGAERLGRGDLSHRIRVDSRDELASVAATFNDLADRLLLQDEQLRHRAEELREAKEAADVASRAKSRFLANTSHELRTPLNAIIGYSEMLIEEAADRESSAFVADLQKIRSSGRSLLALINDVLDLSRMESGQLETWHEPVDLDGALGEVIAKVRPLVLERGSQLDVEVRHPLGWARTDGEKLRQILGNLLTNAANFTLGGPVEASAEIVADDGGRSQLQVRVTDNGPGMTPGQLDRLFEPLMRADSAATRDYGGTGLGLTLAKQYAELLGGELRVASEPGSGTSFHLRVPAESCAPQLVVSPAPTGGGTDAGGADSSSATILVIDDDPAARELAGKTLSSAGYRVIRAAAGEEGLRLAQELHPDLITLDVVMPGADGWAVLKALKEDSTLSHVPVVMLTVLAHRNVAFTLGASEFLQKPVDSGALVRTVRRLLRERRDTVLVVDDDGATRALLRRGLTRGGMAVVEAEDGGGALDVLRRSRPELVLLDLMMPGVDGFAFIERMEAATEGRRIPVIVLTAKEITQEDRDRLRGRVVKVLRKGGLPGEELLTEVRRALDAAGAGASTAPLVPGVGGTA